MTDILPGMTTGYTVPATSLVSTSPVLAVPGVSRSPVLAVPGVSRDPVDLPFSKVPV